MFDMAKEYLGYLSYTDWYGDKVYIAPTSIFLNEDWEEDW